MANGVMRIRRAVNDGIVAGAGAATAELPGLVDRCGARRVALMSTPSVARSPLLGAVADALGDRHAITFDGSRAHTPREAVLEGAAAARDAGADALVSLGGSSVVDMTKGVAMVLAEGDDFDAMTVETRNRLIASKVPHIAVPTTLSAAEFTAAAGITNTTTGVKELFASATLAPRWVILDSEMTTATPQRLWAGTGMKLVADCLEGMLSARSTQYSVALLQGALGILIDDLGAGIDQLDARGRCLEAAHMTLSNLHNVGIGAVGALRHQIGGRCGVPHGEASTIVLPHVMQWNGTAAEPTLDRIASNLGLGSGAHGSGSSGSGSGGSDSGGSAALIDLVASRTIELGLPTTLREVGVGEDQLGAIAEHAAAEGAARTNVRPADAAGLREVLDAAF